MRKKFLAPENCHSPHKYHGPTLKDVLPPKKQVIFAFFTFMAQGYVDVEWLRDDPLLDAVRNETRFGEMLADLEDRRRRDLGA